MASNIPIIRQIAWISLIPQILLIGILSYLFSLLKYKESFLLGVLSYVILSYILRNTIAKYHRKGIKQVRNQKFNEAISSFQKSVNFFTNHAWLDKYRFVTLLSSSKMTYKEMGLCNVAFCYSQINNGQKAKEYYELTLTEFPDNALAIAGLKMLNSVKV